MAAHGVSDIFGENLCILRRPAVISQHFKNGSHISDGYALPKHICQNLLNLAHGQDIRDDLVYKRAVGLLQVVYQILSLLTTKYLIGMSLDDLSQMGSKYGYCIDDGVAVELCLLPLLLRYPECRKSEGRLNGFYTGDFFEDSSRIHG